MANTVRDPIELMLVYISQFKRRDVKTDYKINGPKNYKIEEMLIFSVILLKMLSGYLPLFVEINPQPLNSKQL